jgi:DNA topoisomerase-1
MRLPSSWKKLTDLQRRERERRARIKSVVKADVSALLDGQASARAAGLRYVDCRRLIGIRRTGPRTAFRYVGPDGRVIRNKDELARIKALVLPPAWKDVWICPFANGHLQATGRDVRGRLQYRYHTMWRTVRDEVKYGRLLSFAEALPRVRRRTAEDVALPGLPREKVLATVVQLLEKTFIRVGNEEYARTNGSIGLTTMKDGHAKVDGGGIRFVFRGKSGVPHEIGLTDKRLARIVRACRDLPGQELFQYRGADGTPRGIDSADVNAYLHQISGSEFTAKDFRTWAGTVLAARALADAKPPSSQAAAKRQVAAAVERVAQQLGNTKAVCRKCYIHPVVVDAYLEGTTIGHPRGKAPAAHALTPEEQAVVRLLSRRLKQKTA